MITRTFRRSRLGIILVLSIIIFNLGSWGNSEIVYGAETWTEITNAAGLQNITNNLSGHYRIAADIDLGGAEFSPIGSIENPFTGVLDGNSKVISNFKITNTSSAYKGLFAAIGSKGTVTDLGINLSQVGAGITAAEYAGILAGSCSGTINKCYTKGNITGTNYIGGLVGLNSGTITESYTIAGITGIKYIGGIAGSNTGTIAGCYSASSVTALPDHYDLLFEGDDYITIPDSELAYNNLRDYTIEAWFQWNNPITNNVDFIIGKGIEQYEIHTGGGSGPNGIRFIPFKYQYGNSYLDLYNVIVQNTWCHISVVNDYTNNKAEVYINGELAITRDNIRTQEYSYIDNDITIGCRSDISSFFHGVIKEVRLWNYARTQKQIGEDMSLELSSGKSGLIGYWKIGEASDRTVTDSSIYHNDGTIISTDVSEPLIRNPIYSIYRGGLSGNNQGTVTDSYYDSTVYVSSASGQSVTGGGEPKETINMKLSDTYTAWDFFGTWGLDPSVNNGYPYLSTVNEATVAGSGKALSFDGLDDYVDIPADAAFDTNQFTVETWMQYSTKQGWKAVVDKGRNLSENWYILTHNSDNIGVVTGIKNVGELSYAWNDTNWHHVAT